jgi:hypothetical protein
VRRPSGAKSIARAAALVGIAAALIGAVAPAGAATAAGPVSVQIILEGAARDAGSCTSSTQSVNSSSVVRVACTSNEYVTVQPLPSAAAVGYGDALRLNFDADAQSRASSNPVDGAVPANASAPAVSVFPASAQGSPQGQADAVVPIAASSSGISMERPGAGTGSMFLVRGFATGVQMRNGSTLAMWIDDLNPMNGLVELLVSF